MKAPHPCQPNPPTGPADNVSDPVRDVLQALLRIDAATAATVRERSPARLRARTQRGPSGDYGTTTGSASD